MNVIDQREALLHCSFACQPIPWLDTSAYNLTPHVHVQWNFAFQLKFGLYEWNDDGTQERRLRDGAKVSLPPDCFKKDACALCELQSLKEHAARHTRHVWRAACAELGKDWAASGYMSPFSCEPAWIAGSLFCEQLCVTHNLAQRLHGILTVQSLSW